jgi:hypothetical protein
MPAPAETPTVAASHGHDHADDDASAVELEFEDGEHARHRVGRSPVTAPASCWVTSDTTGRGGTPFHAVSRWCHAFLVHGLDEPLTRREDHEQAD